MCECKCKKSTESLIAPRLREILRVLALNDDLVYSELSLMMSLNEESLKSFFSDIKEEVFNKKFSNLYNKMMFDDIERRILSKLNVKS